MKRNVTLGILTLLAMDLHAASPADACGVKLTVKSSTPRKAVARTSNPSDVLLLGDLPHRFEVDLTAAGHRVEVAHTPQAAARKSYAVVITDASLQNAARSNFPGAVVIVRSGDVAADMRALEQQVARRPVRTDEARPVVAAQARRAPIAAGPPQPPARPVVNASEQKDAQVTPDTPPPERVATAVPRPGPVASEAKPPPASSERPTPGAAAHPVHDEVYFAFSSSTLASEANAPLNRAVRWLTDNSDVHVVIEGHADPTGSHAFNMALGQQRAEAVRNYLTTAGIDSSRLEVVSYGDTRLKYSRTDRRNRRAAIVSK